MTKEEIFKEITGSANIRELSIGDRMSADEIEKAMDMYADAKVKNLANDLLLDFLAWFGRTYSPEELKIIGMQQLIDEYEKSKQ